MGRCPKSVDTWAPHCEEPQSRSTTTIAAVRLSKQSNSAMLAAGSCPPSLGGGIADGSSPDRLFRSWLFIYVT
eukprot:scaffold9278_cov117-Isochrysis_galbana.AAC.11